MNTNNSVMALATTFADRGDWTVEQQFVLQMGSSYLLAHGINAGRLCAHPRKSEDGGAEYEKSFIHCLTF